MKALEEVPEALKTEHARDLADPARGDIPRPLATVRDNPPQVAGRIAGPTDQELEAAIVQAVMVGATDVARTLAAQLEDRRRATLGNVIPMRRGPKT